MFGVSREGSRCCLREEDHAAEVAVEPSPDPARTATGARRRPVKPRIRRRSSIRWPIAAWWPNGPWVARAVGPRPNELEESGLYWRDAETQAFVEVWNLPPPQQPAASAPRRSCRLPSGIKQRIVHPRCRRPALRAAILEPEEEVFLKIGELGAGMIANPADSISCRKTSLPAPRASRRTSELRPSTRSKSTTTNWPPGFSAWRIEARDFSGSPGGGKRRTGTPGRPIPRAVRRVLAAQDGDDVVCRRFWPRRRCGRGTGRDIDGVNLSRRSDFLGERAA